MKQIKAFLLVIILLVATFVSVPLFKQSTTSHAQEKIAVYVWASSGTLTANGSMFKMIEVAVDEPNMVDLDSTANEIDYLRAQVRNKLRNEKDAIIAYYTQKVDQFTGDANLKQQLLTELVVSENDANTIVELRFLRIEFKTDRALKIYTQNQTAQRTIEEGYLVDKITEINPPLFWGVLSNDTFAKDLTEELQALLPQNGVVKLYYQYQSVYRRLHSNADRVQFQINNTYLHEWEDKEDLQFVLFRYEANRSMWYTIALIATALFTITGLYVAKRVNKKEIKLQKTAEENILEQPMAASVSKEKQEETSQASKETVKEKQDSTKE